MMFTKTQDGKYTDYRFQAAGYEFYVRRSPTGYWLVYRQERGQQLRHWGKAFWRSNDMIAHYRTAAVQLALIAADSEKATA